VDFKTTRSDNYYQTSENPTTIFCRQRYDEKQRQEISVIRRRLTYRDSAERKKVVGYEGL
jgi:hypothetical protein